GSACFWNSSFDQLRLSLSWRSLPCNSGRFCCLSSFSATPAALTTASKSALAHAAPCDKAVPPAPANASSTPSAHPCARIGSLPRPLASLWRQAPCCARGEPWPQDLGSERAPKLVRFGEAAGGQTSGLRPLAHPVPQLGVGQREGAPGRVEP